MRKEGATMLVLTRRNKESVVVGGADGVQRMLKVTVLEIRGEKVKLGFDVDPDIPVHRLEVWERIHNGGQLNPLNHDAAASVTHGGDAGTNSIEMIMPS